MEITSWLSMLSRVLGQILIDFSQNYNLAISLVSFMDSPWPSLMASVKRFLDSKSVNFSVNTCISSIKFICIIQQGTFFSTQGQIEELYAARSKNVVKRINLFILQT